MVIRLAIYFLIIIIQPLAAQSAKEKNKFSKKDGQDTLPQKAAAVMTPELSEEKSRSFLGTKFYEFKNAQNDSIFISTFSDEPFHYVIFKRGDHPEDIEAQVFDRKVGEVVGPFNGDHYNYLFKIVEYSDNLLRMRASQIFFPIQAKSVGDSINAYTKADECLKALKKGKQDFHQLYLQYSANFDDKILKYHEAWRPRIDGDLGYFWDGHMMPEFNHAVKKAKKGDVFLVRTKYGLHVVKVTEEMSKSFYKVKLIPLIKNYTRTENPVIIKQANIIKKQYPEDTLIKSSEKH